MEEKKKLTRKEKQIQKKREEEKEAEMIRGHREVFVGLDYADEII